MLGAGALCTSCTWVAGTMWGEGKPVEGAWVAIMVRVVCSSNPNEAASVCRGELSTFLAPRWATLSAPLMSAQIFWVRCGFLRSMLDASAVSRPLLW